MDRKKDINTVWMVQDTQCWVEVGQEDSQTKSMYIKAKIKELDTNKKKVTLDALQTFENLPKSIGVENVFQTNVYETTGYDDMVTMDNLNEAEIIYNLDYRYSIDKIFTYIGPTLVVMNPYQPVPHLVSQQILEKYQLRVIKDGFLNLQENEPHTYAVAGLAFCKLFENTKNQAIVISGQSGAGKTENAQIAMQFLTTLSSHEGHEEEIKINQTSIQDRILSCNPILEAFGNAKTVRNDNSSRFGKYVRILVDSRSRKIQGATITNYLLEQSRVTTQGQGERNYHIFYQILMGLNRETMERIGLVDSDQSPLKPQDFQYLKVGGCLEVPSINDIQCYQEVEESFETMKFEDLERTTILQCLAATLVLGNISFDSKTLSDSKPCTLKNRVKEKSISNILFFIYQKELLILLERQLDISQLNLEKCLLFRSRAVGDSIIQTPLSEEDCISNRDSIARNLYDKLFSWLVKRLNLTIIPQEEQQEHMGSSFKNISRDGIRAEKLSIGLLDIFGFEVFKVNSFEQFCINYTNEKLQQLYIQYVFKSEQDQFIQEGLKDYISQLGFKDNQSVIDLMDKYPMGIFDLLDQSTSLGQGNDSSLYQKIVKTHKDNPSFGAMKSSKDTFCLVHTAKTVEYNINGFRNKNKAEISATIQNTFLNSKNNLLSDIYLGIAGDETLSREEMIANLQKPNQNDQFLGAKFRQQMKQLMDELISSDCHFIRCIKPNELQKKDFFLQGYCLIQIKYLGVLEAIYVRKEGFPYRKDFQVFYQQFGDMVKKFRGVPLQKHLEAKNDLKLIAQEILQQILPLDEKNCLYGKSQLFAQDPIGRQIDQLLHHWIQMKQDFARKIQKQFLKQKC